MKEDQIQRELEIHKVHTDGLGRLAPLFETCFAKAVGARYFDWKFRNNPAGHLIAYEALHNGRSVAFYGVIPEPWKVGGVAVRAWQSMDTMTHPDYQRRGLFVSLAKRTYADLEAVDPSYLLVGIPGPMSYGGLVDKLGWREAGTYPAMFSHRSVVAALARKTSRQLRARQVFETVPEVAEFLTKRLSRSPLETHFSPEFFQWRVFGNPTKRFTTLSIEDNNGVRGLCVSWVDPAGWLIPFFLDFENPEDFTRLTPLALREAMSLTHTSKTYAWVPRSADRRAGYRAAGLRQNTTSHGPMRYSQPLTVLSPTWRLHEVDVQSADSYDFQPLMQD